MRLTTVFEPKIFLFSDSCVYRDYDTSTISNFVYNKIDLSIQAENKNGSDTKSCSVVRKAPTNRYFHN